MPLLHRRCLPLLLASITGCAERSTLVWQAPNPGSSYLPPFVPPLQTQGTIFFDEDSAELTAKAREIISEHKHALENFHVSFRRGGNSVPIRIEGHSNSAETTRFGVVLSQRRAENVASEWVRNGYLREALQVQSLGGSVPLGWAERYAADEEVLRRRVIMRFG